MRIYDLDGLPPGLLPQLGTFQLSDGDPPQGVEFIRRLRRTSHPSSDYFAVYAVDDGKLLSRVETLQLPFTGPTGSDVVVGISDVLTRPDGVGRGLARSLLDEVHRRERVRGRHWSYLWTRRSWGAHRLYESMGYKDVFSPPSALGEAGRSRRRRSDLGYRLTPERSTDGRRLERVLREATAGRLGFVPRTPGSFRTRIYLGWRKPESHLLLRRGARTVGFAHLSDDSRWNLSVNEVVVTGSEHQEPMVRCLEGLAGRRSLTFQGTTFVRDAERFLRARGYQVLAASHSVLMAKALGPRRTTGADLRTVFADPR
ncbi:MAG: GNAT family N-acetyltransferase, partial [Candidatus Lutacidiplasmatales archaeon]